MTEFLPILIKHFSCPLPLLDELKINFMYCRDPTLPDDLFNGNLSSLRELTLVHVIAPLPWRDLSNLTTFDLCEVPEDKILLTQLLDFFGSAPYFRHIRLDDSLPSSSNAPTEEWYPSATCRISTLSQDNRIRFSLIISQSRPEHRCVWNSSSMASTPHPHPTFLNLSAVSPISLTLPRSISASARTRGSYDLKDQVASFTHLGIGFMRGNKQTLGSPE